MLVASTDDFGGLVGFVRQLLESVQIVVSCVADTLLSDATSSALAEIDSIDMRDIQVVTMTDNEEQKIVQYGQQLLELPEKHEQLVQEHGRLQEAWREKHGRKFDAIASFVKSRIQDELIEGKFARIILRFRYD